MHHWRTFSCAASACLLLDMLSGMAQFAALVHWLTDLLCRRQVRHCDTVATTQIWVRRWPFYMTCTGETHMSCESVTAHDQSVLHTFALWHDQGLQRTSQASFRGCICSRMHALALMRYLRQLTLR